MEYIVFLYQQRYEKTSYNYNDKISCKYISLFDWEGIMAYKQDIGGLQNGNSFDESDR